MAQAMEGDDARSLAQSGLVAWLLGLMKTPRAARRMELVEVLALGGKRQLMLVRCDGVSYLVGGGADGIQTIVAMKDVACEG